MFCGLGLVHSLDGDFSGFTRMVQLLSQSIRVAVIPMIAETNMLGFSQSLHKQTSYVNSVSFASGVSHGRQFSFLEQVHNHAADCILIVGSDPFSTLPQSLLSKLQGVDIICLDHFSTLTTEAADVVIPTAVPGVESRRQRGAPGWRRHRAGGADQGRIPDAGSDPATTAGEGAAMTSPQNGILLTIVTHEDVHLAIAKLRDGWGDAYQKKAAVRAPFPGGSGEARAEGQCQGRADEPRGIGGRHRQVGHHVRGRLGFHALQPVHQPPGRLRVRLFNTAPASTSRPEPCPQRRASPRSRI